MFEKNACPGGKLSELQLGAYRFDKGPSLLTLPELILELKVLSGFNEDFSYRRLDTLTHYFFEDATVIRARASADAFAQELSEKLGEDENQVRAYFKRSRFYYESTAALFLHQSLSRPSNFLNLKTLRGIVRSPRLGLLSSMHNKNLKSFRNKKTVQIFDRYATYNGSDPYKAPALLNQIPHLEFGLGAYLPEKGMHDITRYLYRMAQHAGVLFHFNETVEQIRLENNRVTGLVSNGIFHPSQLVVCNADIYTVYKRLLPPEFSPQKTIVQEKSSSAYVFYWGVRKTFPELELHNILFSNNYEAEFKCLFEGLKPYHDPTIYINITSKLCTGDAPAGCENWFVMVNVPHNAGSNPITYGQALRSIVIRKINRMLKTDIEPLIEAEEKLDPKDIEVQTSSYGGSLYGNASNSRLSAFLRHANYSKTIKGLYFAGGSVHPGGGIPLCLLSAKITTQLILQDHAV